MAQSIVPLHSCRGMAFMCVHPRIDLSAGMLDTHAIIHRVKGHPLIGGFDATKFSKAQMYCRVGKYANTIRMAMAKIKELGIPQNKYSKSRTWTRCLPEDNAFSDSTCANLVKTAIAESRSDWHSECNMFECEYKPQLPEEWSDDAWTVDQGGRTDTHTTNIWTRSCTTHQIGKWRYMVMAVS